MTIHFTFDFELFFGPNSGTVQNCLIVPTERLLDIANRHQVKFTFFIDTGYLIALKKASLQYPSLENDVDTISHQIKRMVKEGHTCGLHIHPHWIDSLYENGKWQINVARYKLSDFDSFSIAHFFETHQACFESLTGYKATVYRAGGWCIQPFFSIKESFEKNGLFMDSSVFAKGYLKDETHFFDFRKAPEKSMWKFSDDVCREDDRGSFIELPISSQWYSPLFFWNLFVKGRLNRSRHKAIGDGQALGSALKKWEYLTKGQHLPLSSDGYFVTALPHALTILNRKGIDRMVVIGHPKACTDFSLQKLEEFVLKYKNSHSLKGLEINL